MRQPTSRPELWLRGEGSNSRRLSADWLVLIIAPGVEHRRPGVLLFRLKQAVDVLRASDGATPTKGHLTSSFFIYKVLRSGPERVRLSYGDGVSSSLYNLDIGYA